MTTIQLYGFIAIIAGAALRLIIRRRVFYRTDWGGTQRFRSFTSYIITVILETTFRIIGWGLLLFGALMLLTGYFNSHYTI